MFYMERKRQFFIVILIKIFKIQTVRMLLTRY
jgi:hypothetical protein